ncbi:amino acid/polyamine transporter I [Exophiala viscosa]|uniref:Amino acid/polyamine transporter I n=1 Tax=Exophiala viscosa TaxID=2486360 RepID=A0AAN6DPQ1_9EURO|nr:amino acid/polyamine transporter I [Exophiala viscosa]
MSGAADSINAMEAKGPLSEEQKVYISSGINPVIPDVQMRKRFSFLSLYAIFVAGTAGVLVAGGPTVLVWGFVISAVAACCIAFSLAEFASIWPSAAGQYHWAVALAPRKYKAVVGWYSAWILLMMNLLSSLSAMFAGAFSLQAAVLISVDSYTSERYHTCLIIIAIIILAMLINIFMPHSLHYISLVAVVVVLTFLGGTFTHVAGFFAIIITLLATTKNKNSGKEVFGSLENYTGYHNTAAAFFIGLLPTATGFSTLDLPARYAEETKKPHEDVSRAMFWGVLTSAAIGLPFVLTIAFCMGDPAVLLTSPIASHSPLAAIVYNSTGSIGAAITLACTIIIVAVVSAIDCMGGISRIIMAQSRDGVIPCGHVFAKINLRWNTPINAVLLASFIQACIALIYIGNSTAFYCILSGVFTLQVLSYGLPIALHLFRRKTMNLTYGPWKMRWYGYLVNGLGLILYAILFVAVSLPTGLPVTAADMNYAAPIAGITLILATILWFAWGRRQYLGAMIVTNGITAGTEVGQEKGM